MNKNDKFIITINRELGSGGRTIGRKLAEKLGVTFYDKWLINELNQTLKVIFTLIFYAPSMANVGPLAIVPEANEEPVLPRTSMFSATFSGPPSPAPELLT